MDSNSISDVSSVNSTPPLSRKNSNVLHINSPLVESIALNRILNNGTRCWLKLDAMQPSGSFKIRGIGLHCSRVVNENGVKRLICSSGGNAGKSVAYAGRKLGVPTTIVLPTTIPQETIDKIKSEGAEVVVHGNIWDEADIKARQIAMEQGANGMDGYIHPFDHPSLWEGHSTLIDEIVYDVEINGTMPRPDVIICSVGGGGLLAGIVQGLKKARWDDVPILAIETHGSHSLHECVKQGQHVKLEVSQVTSICKTLATRSVCKEAYECTLKHQIISALVTDKEAVDACISFVDDERVLVEPACGAGLASIYGKIPQLLDLNPKNILTIVCGGNNTSMKQLMTLSTQLSN